MHCIIILFEFCTVKRSEKELPNLIINLQVVRSCKRTVYKFSSADWSSPCNIIPRWSTFSLFYRAALRIMLALKSLRSLYCSSKYCTYLLIKWWPFHKKNKVNREVSSKNEDFFQGTYLPEALHLLRAMMIYWSFPVVLLSYSKMLFDTRVQNKISN